MNCERPIRESRAHGLCACARGVTVKVSRKKSAATRPVAIGICAAERLNSGSVPSQVRAAPTKKESPAEGSRALKVRQPEYRHTGQGSEPHTDAGKYREHRASSKTNYNHRKRRQDHKCRRLAESCDQAAGLRGTLAVECWCEGIAPLASALRTMNWAPASSLQHHLACEIDHCKRERDVPAHHYPIARSLRAP